MFMQKNKAGWWDWEKKSNKDTIQSDDQNTESRQVDGTGTCAIESTPTSLPCSVTGTQCISTTYTLQGCRLHGCKAASCTAA
jgi:hypothetical protein